jgi:Ser/Thr protein kinase RdoA (MazF antagonist)
MPRQSSPSFALGVSPKTYLGSSLKWKWLVTLRGRKGSRCFFGQTQSAAVSDKSLSPLDVAACEVLSKYGNIRPCESPTPLGNRGGFSGAWLWRVSATTGTYCLRAWPPGGPAPDRLNWIHELMRQARNAGLDFVPAIAITDRGTTWVAHAGRLWDLTTWMPGRADFHDRPTSARLEAACTALARLHAAWVSIYPSTGRCPGIARRLEIAHDWLGLIRSGWRLPCHDDREDPVHACGERAWCLLPALLEGVPRALAPWSGRVLPLQPCLCDIWHDHVLFDGDVVTGLIDYGGAKIDHVAVDLARLLGSMVDDNAAARRTGLSAYARLHPLSWEEEALVHVLEETGTVIAVATWLKWLYRDQKLFADRMAVARRLSKLVDRMEKCSPSP